MRTFTVILEYDIHSFECEYHSDIEKNIKEHCRHEMIEWHEINGTKMCIIHWNNDDMTMYVLECDEGFNIKYDFPMAKRK